MKAAPFGYFAATSVQAAVDELAAADADARVMAGGQTLGPMLNLRLAMPSLLIDLSRISELKTIQKVSGRRVIGACVTHAMLEDHDDGSSLARCLAGVASTIAFRSVRNRGTIGGSIAHADPAADWLTAMTMLNASVRLSGPGGRRTLPLSDFVLGTFTTALKRGEILESIEVAELRPDARWGIYKVSQKIGEFPKAIGAVLYDGPISRAVLGALDRPPVMLNDIADRARREGTPSIATLSDAIALIVPELDDIDRHIYAATLERAFKRALT
ncbi:MAG: xanthine dehydrogenase family protein subunit M [Pseudorhodoplanes sp.]|uniref:FAD binding domain-containing protein n=1 Tax=Pseudorhodoplanes sp. TaxID=1934341 RepID=UPI003D0D7515